MRAECCDARDLVSLKWLVSQTAEFSRRLLSEVDAKGCPDYARSMIALHRDFLLSHGRTLKGLSAKLDDDIYSCCPHKWETDWFDSGADTSNRVTYCQLCELAKRS